MSRVRGPAPRTCAAPPSTSRRAFLASGALGAAALAGCAGARPTAAAPPTGAAAPPAGAAAPPAGATAPPAGATAPPTGAAAPAAAAAAAGWAAALRAGQRLVGIVHTDAELEQMARSFEEQLGLVRARRALPDLPRSLAPASVFVVAPPASRGVADRVRLRPAPARPRGRPAPPDDELAYASLAELGAWLDAGAVTATALAELALARLRRHGRDLECVITLTEERARAEAAAADQRRRRRRRRGPLDGIPYGLKDLFDTRAIATTFGAEPYRARVPDADAAVVARLTAAGAVLCAKLSLGALAYGDRWFGGRTRNPWNPEEGSSGSSAGPAAAVAAGLVPFALGSETLGSIVAPATRCGVVGLRPSFGHVARTGAMPLCWSLDKVGPLTRTVEDAVAVLRAVHGADPGDPASVSRPLRYAARADLRGVRIAHLPGLGKEGRRSRQLDAAVIAALRELGAAVVEAEPIATAPDGLLPILLAESAAAFEPLTLGGGDDTLAWQDDEAWPNTFRLARFLSAVDLIQAERLRRRFMDEMAAAMATYDAILSPSSSPLLTVTNFTGHPSLTLRVGFALRRTRPRFDDDEIATGPTHRVPHAVTLYGRLFEDGALCAIGELLERRLDVWRERPTLRD